MEGNDSTESRELKLKSDNGEITMILPCPCCAGTVGLYPIDREQSIFSVASHCSCKRGLNGGVVIIKDLCGCEIGYLENGEVLGVFNRLKGEWIKWNGSN